MSASISIGQYKAFAQFLKENGFRGDIDGGLASRAAFSTDNSVYQIEPGLIVSPENVEDVCLVASAASRPEFKSITLTARGAGTGTNGQSLTDGVVVNFQRRMHRVLDINLAEQWVDVEPGVVLAELNERLRPSGLFFAPETSTANRCTIGGMVSTDASGKGSRIYGKTSDNVYGVQAVVHGGLLLDSLALPRRENESLFAELAAACDAGREDLLRHVPALARRFSGYDIERARPSRADLEWWRLLIGAEGTLGLITKVRLKLTSRPLHNRLVIVAFETFSDAIAAAQQTIAFNPIAVESLDDWVQQLADEAGLLDDLPPEIRGQTGRRPVFNFVEFAGDDEKDLQLRVEAFQTLLPDLAGYVGAYLATDSLEIARLWAIRSASVGLLGRSKTSRKPVAFIEDCVVPPSALPEFVDSFRKLLQREGLAFGIYGHVDVGCLHVRPALDIADPVDRQTLKRVSDAVYDLVKHHGGIFWGEHGKGIRGEYLEDFVGTTAYAAFRRIKAALDPANQFNPGKLVSVSAPLRSIAGTPFRLSPPATGDIFAQAFECNGNAVCLSYSTTVPMCPSFKVTKDLRHSPKGRAEALKIWHLARKANSPDLTAVAADALAVLDGCLGCAACAGTCPMHIDIPELKSRFLEVHHVEQPRSLADKAVVALERYSPVLSRLRALHALAWWSGVASYAARKIGIVDTPAPSTRGLRRLGYPVRSPFDAGREPAGGSAVFVATDPFTTLFDIDAVAAVCDGLKALGYRPMILALPPGGKAAHVKGNRKSFLYQADRLRAAIDLAGTSKIPIVAVEPTYALMLRKEYRTAGIEPATQVFLVQEFLQRARTAGDIWPLPRRPQRRVKLFPHCTEVTRASGVSGWATVFDGIGIDVEVQTTGCCGMSGTYGHEARHQGPSKELFELSWANRIESEETVYASGFSCRCQVERFGKKAATHPMALVAAAFKS